jgi:GntR family transcriptional regulator/MocR family aminotransferase
VLPPPLVQPFVAAKSLWDSGTPMLEQAALLEFMRSGQFERHIRKMRRLYRSRRDALVGALSSAFGERVEVGVRHGGLNMLITLDVPLSDAELIVRAAEAGVGLRSAAPYYASPPPRPTFLIGFGALPENAIEEGVHRLAGVVAEAIEPTQ